jgi:hypothetical protein
MRELRGSIAAERRAACTRSHGFPKLTYRFPLGIHTPITLFGSLLFDTVAIALYQLGTV